jgi:phytoene desaturase (3,4-didehydrolycopene-forming)
LQNVARAWPLEGHYAQLARAFRSEKLRAALSFQVILCVNFYQLLHLAKKLKKPNSISYQDLYVGLSPYNAPAVFSLLQAIELNQGVYYPKGGFGQVGRALLRLTEAAVDFRFGSRVEEVVVEEGRARGVRLADGTYAVVVCLCM